MEEAVRAHSLSCVQRIHTIDTPRAQQTKGWKPGDRGRVKDKKEREREREKDEADNSREVG